MPTWWRGKSKLKSKSKSEERVAKGAEVTKKEKARSFDEVAVVARKESIVNSSNSPRGSSSSIFSFDSDAERRGAYHALPRPMILLSGSMPQDNGGSAGASVSISSVSSSASSDETSDLATYSYRFSESAVAPTGRTTTPDSRRQQQVTGEKSPFSCSPVREFSERFANSPVSPKKEYQKHDNVSSGNVYSSETIFSPGSRSPVPRSRGHLLISSPIISSRAFSTCRESSIGKQDDLRSLSHPLPLPPGSPICPASRSLQSKWKKGKLLGRGTFGHVYAGFNRENGQMCAIKEVQVISDDANSKECLKQLAQEINLLSQLSHPNIVQYYGSELVDDTLSVYLEYASGGSIYKLLQDYGPFGEPVIRNYAGQILSGLAYLHGRNTIHRDIKGANILVGSDGDVKLADFGMAKHMSSYASVRSFKGSPYWIAPEVIMNTSGYNLSVDIWSLGCTIVEMATAKPPWNQYTGVQAIFKIGISKDIPEIPDHLSSEGKNFLKLCLQRDPSARPTAAQLLDHPFVRDQTKIKLSNRAMVRDAYPSSDGTNSPKTSDFTYNKQTFDDVARNRSISPIQSRDSYTRPTTRFPSASRSPSDLTSLRVNMSLPVSPCSSPLRQFQQSNWSCLPSPPHPIGASNYGLSNNMSYPFVHSSRFTDHQLELSLLNSRVIYRSPRT